MRDSITGVAHRAFRDRAIYLVIAFATPPLATLAQHGLGGTVSVLGHGPSVLVSGLGLLLALAAWLPYRKGSRWLPASSTILILVLAAWVVQVVMTRLEGVTGLDFTTYTLPVLLIMVLLKPPPLNDVRRSGQAFGVAVVAAMSTVLVLDLAGVGESAFVSTNGVSRITAFTDFLGVDSRWSGPFVHSNLAGPIGGALVILALGERRWLKAVLLTGGVVLLVLSQSRTGIAATAVALLVLGLVRGLRSAYQGVRWATGIAAMLGVLGLASYVVAVDPTLAWRTHAWRDFLDLWVTSPLTGVGDQGVTTYFLSGPVHGPVAFTHAHNLLLDLAARFGVIMLLLTAAILICMTLQSARAVRAHEYVALPLSVLTVTLAIVEVPFSWAYLSTLLVPGLLAIMLGAAALAGSRSPFRSGDVVRSAR